MCPPYSLDPTKFFDIPTPLHDACNVLYMSQLALLDFTRSTGILFFFFIIMKRNKPKYYSHFVKKLAKVEQKKDFILCTLHNDVKYSWNATTEATERGKNAKNYFVKKVLGHSKLLLSLSPSWIPSTLYYYAETEGDGKGEKCNSFRFV